MTPSQKSLVRQTFAQVVPIADQAAALFYGRLFELDPSLRPLFKNDLRAQGQKLMQMIGYAVGKLDAPEELVPAVEGLGVKHVGYGVKDADYTTVGAALLWTLQKGLGPAFTPDVEAAWAAAYAALSGMMMKGATTAGRSPASRSAPGPG
ncbi:MAG TPA: globin family protein [Polyangia bacterium]|nr:globin family protein [Polyangia bacterium]